MNLSFLSLFILVSAVLCDERHYYIQAEEVNWNFAPDLDPSTPAEKTYLENGDKRIGKEYKKCVYRRYTDDDFDHRHPADDRSSGSKWEHLALLGPVLRGCVGDTIYVHFKNTCNFPASVHVHAMEYSKKNEGSNYLGKNYKGGAVPPGEKFTYEWEVDTRSGPTHSDPSTIAWFYHSHKSEPIDTNTGLVGILIIGRDSHDAPDGHPRGIDREFITYYSIIDENQSRYIDDNIKKYTEVHESDDIKKLKKDLHFIESNKKHAINGRLFFTLRGLEMDINEKIRWYVVALGSEVDIHTAHWHGNTAVYGNNRVDVVHVTPGVTLVADMLTDAAGTWMVHCHVNDHLDAGMMAAYTVKGDEDDEEEDDDDDHKKGDDDDKKKKKKKH